MITSLKVKTVTAIMQTFAVILLASNVFALDVLFDVQIPKAGRPEVRIKTNLPDSTKVVIRVFSEKLKYEKEVNTEVVGGLFESGPLEHDGGTMCTGTYTLDIAVELAQFQPESVQSVIGSRGENLNGTFVHGGMLGKRAYYSIQFEVI